MKSKLLSLLPLLVGTAIGAFGATLILRSLAPTKGTPEEQVAILENQLKKANQQLRTWEDSSPRRRPRGDVRENLSRIAEALKEGREVSPDDIFQSFKPLLNDLSPLTRRFEEIEIKRSAEARAAEYARVYELSAAEQNQVFEHLFSYNNEQAKKVHEMLLSDRVGMHEYMKAVREQNRDTAADKIMESMLTGSKREAFIAERLTEKAEQVQNEADGKVKRINDIVKLDEQQSHQLFLNMAHSSRYYDPRMKFEGVQSGLQPSHQGKNQKQALMSVLRPDQKKAYEAHRKERLEKAREDASQYGVSIPDDWDLDDDIDF
jgi:hypothetical protein